MPLLEMWVCTVLRYLCLIVCTAETEIIISSFLTLLQLTVSYSFPDSIDSWAASQTNELSVEYEHSLSFARFLKDTLTRGVVTRASLQLDVATETSHLEAVGGKSFTSDTSSEAAADVVFTSSLLDSWLQATVETRHVSRSVLNSPLPQASNRTSVLSSAFISEVLHRTTVLPPVTSSRLSVSKSVSQPPLFGSMTAVPITLPVSSQPSPVHSIYSLVLSSSQLSTVHVPYSLPFWSSPYASQPSLVSSVSQPISLPLSSSQLPSAPSTFFSQMLGGSSSSMSLQTSDASLFAKSSSFRTVSDFLYSRTLYVSPAPTLQTSLSSLNCNLDDPPLSCNCYMCHDECCIDRLSNNAKRNAVLVTLTMADVEMYQAVELTIKSVIAKHFNVYCMGAWEKCLGIASNDSSNGNVLSNRDVIIFQIVSLSVPVQSLQLALVIQVPTLPMPSNISIAESNGNLQTVHMTQIYTTSHRLLVRDYFVPGQVVAEVLKLYRENISKSVGFSIVNMSTQSFVSDVSTAVSSSVVWQLPDRSSDDDGRTRMIIVIVCAVGGSLLLVILFIIVYCYTKQRMKSVPLAKQYDDYELDEMRKSKQEAKEQAASVGQPVHGQNRKQSHKYDPDEGKTLGKKLLPPLSNPHHSRRIRQILKRGRTSAISPELVLDDDNDDDYNQLFPETAVGIPNSLRQAQIAWGMNVSISEDCYLRRGTLNANPSILGMQDHPPRKMSNGVRLPVKTSAVVQIPEVLRSPKRRLPNLIALETPSNM